MLICNRGLLTTIPASVPLVAMSLITMVPHRLFKMSRLVQKKTLRVAVPCHPLLELFRGCLTARKKKQLSRCPQVLRKSVTNITGNFNRYNESNRIHEVFFSFFFTVAHELSWKQNGEEYFFTASFSLCTPPLRSFRRRFSPFSFSVNHHPFERPIHALSLFHFIVS